MKKILLITLTSILVASINSCSKKDSNMVSSEEFCKTINGTWDVVYENTEKLNKTEQITFYTLDKSYISDRKMICKDDNITTIVTTSIHGNWNYVDGIFTNPITAVHSEMKCYKDDELISESEENSPAFNHTNQYTIHSFSDTIIVFNTDKDVKRASEELGFKYSSTLTLRKVSN